jgi:hypothetical protein
MSVKTEVSKQWRPATMAEPERLRLIEAVNNKWPAYPLDETLPTVSDIEVAVWFGMTREELRTSLAELKLPHISIAGRLMFKRSTIRDWLNKREVTV